MSATIDRETLARNIAAASGKTAVPEHSWEFWEQTYSTGSISDFWLNVADLLIQLSDERFKKKFGDPVEEALRRQIALAMGRLSAASARTAATEKGSARVE